MTLTPLILADAGMNAVVDTAVYGGSFGDNLKTSLINEAGAMAAGYVGDNTDSRSLENIAGHTVVGCALGEASGGDCGSGALGGAVSAIAAPIIGDRVDNGDGVLSQQELVAIEELSKLSAGLAAMATGNDTETAIKTAQNEVANNYLSNWQKEKYREERDACPDFNCKTGVAVKYFGISKQQDAALFVGLTEGLGKEFYNEAAELVSLLGNPSEAIEGLRAVINDPSLIAKGMESEVEAIRADLNTLQTQYEVAGWDGANEAGEALGRITAKVIATVGLSATGAGAVAKVSGKVLAKAAEVVGKKLDLVNDAGRQVAKVDGSDNNLNTHTNGNNGSFDTEGDFGPLNQPVNEFPNGPATTNVNSVRLNNQLHNDELISIGQQDSRLANAVNGSGSTNPNLGIGSATKTEADRLGALWVGDGAKPVANQAACPGCLKSADGTRVYRPPTQKNAPAEYNPTGVQANFVRLDENGKIISNGHLVVE